MCCHSMSEAISKCISPLLALAPNHWCAQRHWLMKGLSARINSITSWCINWVALLWWPLIGHSEWCVRRFRFTFLKKFLSFWPTQVNTEHGCQFVSARFFDYVHGWRALIYSIALSLVMARLFTIPRERVARMTVQQEAKQPFWLLQQVRFCSF